MTKEQFEREAHYGAAMAIAREMLAKGIISDRDYHKINSLFLRKYKPIIGSLKAANP